jgi:hypothetical protein
MNCGDFILNYWNVVDAWLALLNLGDPRLNILPRNRIY